MAITLPRTVQLGGGVTLYSGTYAHTAGAAEETFNLGSARVQRIYLTNQDSGGRKELASFTESVSGNTNTVTVSALVGITSGRIEVEAYAGQ